MAIKLKNNIIDYYHNPAGFVKDGIATVDSTFKCDELERWIYDNSYDLTYKDGVFDKLALNRKYYETEDATPLKDVRVWQLKQGFDFDLRFIAYDEMVLKYGAPTYENYEVVFDDALSTNDLEQIYQICNLNHPQGYTGHSLSMSDVVELYTDEESEFFYVDKFGFKQIEFTDTTQAETMEMQAI